MAEVLSNAGTGELTPPGPPAEALARVPGYLAGPAVRITRLPGGSVNRTYEVATSAGRFAVRMSPGTDAWLSADRSVERELHALAAAAGIAPRIIHADAHDRWLITEFVAGRGWTENNFTSCSSLSELAGTLRRLHLLPAPASARADVLEVLGGYVRRIDAADPQLKEYLREAGSAWSLVRAGGRPPAIVHHDLHASNLIASPRGLVMIDWECAAVADPLLDIACILSYYDCARSHARLLLEQAGLGNVTATELAAARWLFDLHTLLWYRERRQRLSPTQTELAAEQRLAQRVAHGFPAP